MKDIKKIQYDASSEQIGLGIEYPIELDAKRRYAVGCYNPEDWDHIHEVLTKDGTIEDNIPCDCIECIDIKEHSSTRAVYLLNNQEAEDLKNHPKVKYVNEDFASYPIKYKPNPDDLKSTAIRNYRYPSPGTKQYRNWFDFNQLPTTGTSADYNRSGYQLLRMQERDDVWYTGVGAGSSQILTNRLQYYGDGSDVDVIVGDEGCWFGHVEFQNNSTAGGPTNYVGGNLLKAGFSASATTGTCDLLDLCLDAPYYIDPAWFEASPGTRLTTRWDGTKVPVESVARSWWGNSSQRSVGFSTIGTISITSSYTRASCLGSNTVRPTNGTDHGTDCAANTYGRTQGWAFNCNKWSVNAYGNNGTDIEQYFDMMKLFHLYKPINSQYGTKDPTISSNSWGYRSTDHRTTGFYFYRQGLNEDNSIQGTSYTSSTLPGFMNYVGSTGDINRMKGEHTPNSYLDAGAELIAAGVIFVGAAGNGNQKQVSFDHPDYDNYWTKVTADTGFTAIASASTRLTGTDSFSVVANSSKRITTSSGSGTVTTISNSLLGAGSLTESTTQTQGGADDGYWELTLPFNISFNGTTYSTIYPGTNFYITFGGGSTAYNSLGLSNPAFNKVMISAADNSTQRIYYGTEGTSPNRTYRIRLEGTSSTSGIVGSPTMVYEAVFYENAPSQIDIHMGSNPRFPSGGVGLGSTASYSQSTHLEFGVESYNSTNRRGFPQQLGKFVDNDIVVYPVINIGALDDSFASDGRERKVNYSDMGNEIDCYAPADGTLTSQAPTGTYARPDTYSGGTLISYDGKFSGTSSACPVACGLIATKLQYNRSWTYADVRSWLQGAVGVGTTTRFDSGVESTTANAGTWSNMNSLEGGSMILLWDALTGNEPDDQPSVPSVGLSVSISGSLSFTGISIS